MLKLFKNLLDAIFPPSPEASLIETLSQKDIDECFFIQSYNVVSLPSFNDRRIRALIHEAKFHENKNAFILLGQLFQKYLDVHQAPVDIIIPIPLSKKRLHTRGYNQVTEVLRTIKQRDGILLKTDILRRTRDTRPQTELGREERLRNMQNAFGVLHGEQLKGKHLLLVDDVETTGTTLQTAKAALLPYSPASITCVALAH